MIINFILILLIELLIHIKNKLSIKLAHKLMDLLKPTKIKSKYGFNIYFKKTEKNPTSIRKTVISGTYELDTLKAIKRLVKSGSIAIDVGAHEGYVSLFLSKLVGKNGKIFSIEPNPENLEYLKTNIACNQINNIEVIGKAISDKPGKSWFHCNPDGGAWGSLIHFSYFETTKSFEVEVDTLDNIFFNSSYQISFIKVDTEGNELSVIMGSEKILSKHKPIILFEVSLTFWAYLDYSIDRLFEIFKKYEYSLYTVENDNLIELKWLNRRIMNIFAIPNKK